jgi:RNA polymerase sigma factor (sigma-70 family)
MYDFYRGEGSDLELTDPDFTDGEPKDLFTDGPFMALSEPAILDADEDSLYSVDEDVGLEGLSDEEIDLVRLYLVDISQYPLLTKDDEQRLAKEIEAGNKARQGLSELEEAVSPESMTASQGHQDLLAAAQAGELATKQFVQSNLRLVVSIAKKYTNSGVPLLDLIQEGNFGLIRAVEKFDWRKNFKFSTYATWWIRQAITRGIANTGRTIRLPVWAADKLVAARREDALFEAERGREPTQEESAEMVGMSTDKFRELLGASERPLLLFEPTGQDDAAELIDFVADPTAESPLAVVARMLLPEEVNKILAPLEDREREILRMRFGLDTGEPRNREEVRKHFGLSRERIRQLEVRTLTKLRRLPANQEVRDLLT